VSLTAPINNAMVQVPVDVLVSASVSAPEVNDTVSQVEFYQGSTLIGTATASPWRITWVKPAAGVYTLTAKATDAQGASTTSTSRKITVLPSELLAVSLSSPTNNQRFTAPASIPLTARVTDPAGTLARVEFYKGGMLIGSRTAPPYSMAWDNVPVGNYSLFAKAIDNEGIETSSAMIAITVTRKAAKIYYLHTDHLDTPRLVTDETNKVVWRNILGEPFGVSPPEEDPDGDGKNFTLNLRFPGQYYDRETNTHYNGARDYGPGEGRYREFDPIGLRGGINGYLYVGGNPLSYRDPLGLWASDAHDYFIDGAFSNLPPAIRDIIKEGSAYADSPSFQGSEYAYMHAMSSELMNPAEAQKLMCKFIKEHLQEAKDAKAAGTARYWFELGMALHPVMDSTSPAHEGFQTWHGVRQDGSKHGPWPTSLENIKVAKQQYHTQRTLQRMKDALNGNLGSCGC
ncbi:Ig-like domain-containing protein, partial [Propionivibrio sp.]|uniref:Ig-like domain-containing protein n=1 Tax=Propionivibrio sp. TaxID=2212460 RepID=UPI002603CB34